MKKYPKEVKASLDKLKEVIQDRQKECTVNKKDMYNVCVALFGEIEEVFEKHTKQNRDLIQEMKKVCFQAFKK